MAFWWKPSIFVDDVGRRLDREYWGFRLQPADPNPNQNTNAMRSSVLGCTWRCAEYNLYTRCALGLVQGQRGALTQTTGTAEVVNTQSWKQKIWTLMMESMDKSFNHEHMRTHTGWFQHIAPNLFSIQCSRRFLKIRRWNVAPVFYEPLLKR